MSTQDNKTEAINQRLEQIEWMIGHAMKELEAAANQMARRAAEAVESASSMLAGQPYGTMWIEFAESDLRRAREAKSRLDELVEQKKMLQFIAKQ